MNNGFYLRLAAVNLRKNGRTILPYLIACTATIAMFFTISSLSQNSGLEQMTGSETVSLVLGLGTTVTGIFSVIFLFYTNSFLLKRRKKEFGLYNILGMEKRHLSRVILWEINRRILIEAGIREEHITVTDLCTRCRPDIFWSHRAEGNARGSLAAFIELTD